MPTADADADADVAGRRAARRAARAESNPDENVKSRAGAGGKGSRRVRVTPEMILQQLRHHDRTVRARESRQREQRMLEQGFRRRNVATLKEAQDALNIAFGAILSAYVGNVLAGLDLRSFSRAELAYFFVLIGLFITGLCIGNSGLLKGHRGLSALFLGISMLSAYLSFGVAHSLGFEVPILQVMYVCWVAALLAGDLVLTGIIYVHHKRSQM